MLNDERERESSVLSTQNYREEDGRGGGAGMGGGNSNNNVVFVLKICKYVFIVYHRQHEFHTTKSQHNAWWKL